MQILGVQIILYFYHHNFLRKALTIFTSVTIYMRNIVRCLLFAFQFRKSITDENRPLGEFWKNTKDLKLKILIRKIDDQVQASWRNREERRGRRTVFIFTEFRELLFIPRRQNHHIPLESLHIVAKVHLTITNFD